MVPMIKKLVVFNLILLMSTGLYAQFPPAAGQAGSTAISKDSAVFTGWATQCHVIRGFQNIADTTLGLVTTGDSSMATGPAGPGGVVSLGDGGSAILTFSRPITDGPGWDFAVFENSFDDTFLELAFAEVSSDGINFFRFPATSLTDTMTQVGTFGTLDATKINNLAGKYRMNYGTPFDLHELDSIAGLDISNITHIRITDVVGSIGNSFATTDKDGRKINDPWPTPFPQGGFDLDAIGVIHQQPQGVIQPEQPLITVFPNPASDHITISLPQSGSSSEIIVTITDLAGRMILTHTIGPDAPNVTSGNSDIRLSELTNGLFFLNIQQNGMNYHTTIIVRH